ncbi:hypothetical protein F5882DRAFT_285172, partial [Hyaloscypha sp. PMI_1271]
EGVSLHSFRGGAAQYTRDTGIPELEIMKLGRWTSKAYTLYYKDNLILVIRTSSLF